LVAVLFAVLYISIQLRASGFLFNVLTGLNINVGMIALSVVLALYVILGGLRAVAEVDRMQFILLAIGITFIGILVLNAVGGWTQWNEGVVTLTQFDYKRAPNTDDYSHYVAIPGVIQFVSRGSEWTGVMLLTFMFALMGIQSAPAFSMWAFSNESPKPFVWQQVFFSAFIVGFILLIFTVIQGLGSHLLGADEAFLNAHPELKGDNTVMDVVEKSDTLIPYLIQMLANIKEMPWLVGGLAICALAAMQSTAAPYIVSTGGILTRDLFKNYTNDQQQILWGRWNSFIIVLVAIGAAILADLADQNIAMLGGLAVAIGLQMWPALVAVCWWPWLTRQGVVAGLITGIVVVILTENPFGVFGPSWIHWPLTIHSAGWGIFSNFLVAIIVSCRTQNKVETGHRMTFHKFLREHGSLSANKKWLIPIAWVVTLVWFIFAVGPGAVLGNDIFGNPNTWESGMPSIWIWQLIWWGLGVAMMFFLAYWMEMSTEPEKKIEPLQADIAIIYQNANQRH